MVLDQESMNAHCFQVSEITDIIKEILESGFPDIMIEGEISNYRPSSTGHLYFSLKDNNAVIQAVMFKRDANKLNFEPVNGQKIVAKGRISVYPQRGGYQIICQTLRISGEGSLLALLEERKRKLNGEGLFDRNRKVELPDFIKKIAVVTSPTGAALRDILRVIGRRNAALDVIILPTPVQGIEAGHKIAMQINRASRLGLADVIIVSRGGGSIEDLLPFSEEEVVRAVADSVIPVISGVGHEIDTPLCDLAADIRAATPSAAAELAARPEQEIKAEINQYLNIIQTSLRGQIESIHTKLELFSNEKMERNLRIFFQPFMMSLDDAKERLLVGWTQMIQKYRHRLELSSKLLDSSSPFGILEKGYAIIRDDKGLVLTTLKNKEEGEHALVQMQDGTTPICIEGETK